MNFDILKTNCKINFLFMVFCMLPLCSWAQFGADYSSYGFNFVNDTFNEGLEGWQGAEINNTAKVNIYKQSVTLNDYVLELKAQNETIQISYDDAGFIDLNPCSFVINLRLNVPQFTGNEDAFNFKLSTGSKLVDIQFKNDGIYYLDANNNTTFITGPPTVNQFLTYTISIDDCELLGGFMIENDPLNTFNLNLPNETQSPIIEMATSTDGATEFEIEIDHLFIYSNPVKWWLGSSVPYGGENDYVGTTGDRHHFLSLPNGERIGINENGGGYMTYTQISPTGTNLYPNPKFGSGGTKTLRNYFQTSDYNPVQAGASSTTGGHLVDVNVLPNQLEIEPYPLHLYYKSGITENNPLTFPNGEVMPDFDDSTDDDDIYDEFGLDMRHEIISELDFSSTLDNISCDGGISVVQHRAEWEFIRHTCQLLQYHEPAGNIRFELDGEPHSDSDMGEMRHKFEFRMNKDLGYEWILWRENDQWQSMQVQVIGDNKTFVSNSPSTIPLENRFMIFSTSNSLTDPNAIAWYYPESDMNINSTIQKSRIDKSEISGEDRRYRVQIIADWRKTNWCRVNLYVFNQGLLAPNHGNTSEYESFQMEALQLFGTPEQIWEAVQVNAGLCPTPTEPTIVVQTKLYDESWTTNPIVSVSPNDSVIFAPQVTESGVTSSGAGTWSWSGPNGYSSNSRLITFEPVTYADIGVYTCTYTVPCGCSVVQDFELVCDDLNANGVCDLLVIASLELNVKILLEGVYDQNGLQNANLSIPSPLLLPLQQPYGIAPYNYNGTENLSALAGDEVDWVLVELRTGTPNLTGARGTQTVATKAAILKTDGSIVGVDSNLLRFENLPESSAFYICVRHRNHLDVLSANPIPTTNPNVVYDFTTNVNQAFGSLQLKPSSDGFFMMYSGDYNQDGTIQITDFDTWVINPALLNVYDYSDGNLDGTVQTTDYDLWFLNKAKLGTVEIGF